MIEENADVCRKTPMSAGKRRCLPENASPHFIIVAHYQDDHLKKLNLFLVIIFLKSRIFRVRMIGCN